MVGKSVGGRSVSNRAACVQFVSWGRWCEGGTGAGQERERDRKRGSNSGKYPAAVRRSAEASERLPHPTAEPEFLEHLTLGGDQRGFPFIDVPPYWGERPAVVGEGVPKATGPPKVSRPVPVRRRLGGVAARSSMWRRCECVGVRAREKKRVG